MSGWGRVSDTTGRNDTDGFVKAGFVSLVCRPGDFYFLIGTVGYSNDIYPGEWGSCQKFHRGEVCLRNAPGAGTALAF